MDELLDKCFVIVHIEGGDLHVSKDARRSPHVAADWEDFLRPLNRTVLVADKMFDTWSRFSFVKQMATDLAFGFNARVHSYLPNVFTLGKCDSGCGSRACGLVAVSHFPCETDLLRFCVGMRTI